MALLLLAALIAGVEGAPQIKIVEPEEGAILAPSDVSVSVEVQDFDLVAKYGQPSAPGEGHINYFMDVWPPTEAGKLAVTAPGTYIATANKSFIWKKVSVGAHSFSVELVNNDHTSLKPPVVNSVNVTMKGDASLDKQESVAVGLVASGYAFNTSTITVPAGADVTLNFENKDSGVLHNVAFYETRAAEKPIYVGQTTSRPANITYRFKAPEKPGTYFFRCDIHPQNMVGDFVVT